MGKITSRNLLSLMECSKKIKLNHLSLKDSNRRKLCFRTATMRLVERYLDKEVSWEIVREEIRQYLDEAYMEEWFLLSWQKVRAIERDLELLERLWYWLPPVRSGAEYKVHVPVEVECGLTLYDVDVSEISGAADLLVSEGGRLHGYIFCRKFSRPYSYRARKPENKVSGSMELLVLHEGLRKLYPEAVEIDVSLVRLVSPSDKADLLAGFDEKKGDNVVTLTSDMIRKDCPGGVISQIKMLADCCEPIACKDCGYHQVCRRVNRVIPIPEKEEIQEREEKKLVLSETQKKVVFHKSGPIRVCAGPGSGKTAVLVARVKQLVADGVPPEKILAVTYTRKAAQEMQERIAMEGPVVSTLHALGFRILTDYEFLIGTKKLAGKVDCKNLLVRILDHAPVIKGVSYEGLTLKYGLIATLLKDFDYINDHGEAEFAAAFPQKDVEGILQVKKLYEDAFKENGYITYDEQISLAVGMLKSRVGLLQEVRSTFDYLLVDEVQDLDNAQAEFVTLLAGDDNPNLMICGDADQSIYSFRGGDNSFMLDFLKIYPGAEDIWLEENYRSSREIVEAASALIARNTERVPMTVKATYETGFRAIHIPCFQERHMPDLIREICAKGYSYGDIAVIARKNSQLSDLCEIAEKEAALSGNAVPMEQPKYYVRDDFSFQFLLNLLELKVKGMDRDSALYRLLSWLGVDVDKKDRNLSIYEDYVSKGLIYPFDGIEAERYFLADGQDPVLKAFGKIYGGLMILNKPLSQAVDAIWEFYEEEALCAEVLQILQELMYEKRIKNAKQLYELMNAMVQFEDDRRIFYPGADTEQVHLLTGHDAKGKEFPVVILYEMDEFEADGTEEDRRLLYVAMTRAKRVLFLLESYPGKSTELKSIMDYITVNRRKRYEM